jgi:hypothetical protein
MTLLDALQIVFMPLGYLGESVAVAAAKPAYDNGTTPEQQAAAKRFLAIEGLVLGVAAAPALYAFTLRRKRKLKAGEERLGVALENAATGVSAPVVTALASPAIAAAFAYLTVQKLEDAGYIQKGLGDAIQTLMAVSAAGPAISGIGNIARSAFAKGAK